MQKLKLSIVFSVLLTVLISCQSKNETSSSSRVDRDSAYAKLSEEEKRLPKNALAGIELADGLKAELFASEPMMGNPTNIDVDARGRVWVCEAFNYRPQLNPENPQREEGDRILILEDTNGDSKADTAKVFYQGTDVNAALGIAVFGNRVIVSCSPNVFVFTDTNGDDKPDQKDLLFTHVGGEQHDHAIHAFTFGPDGKFYFNFGNAGEQLMDKNGKVIIDKEGNEVTAKGKPYRQGMVFRVNPDGTELEVLGHNFRNNYEAAVDSYGTIWQSDNDDDGNQATRINYIMQYGNYGFTNEMTGAGWRSRRTNMEPEIPQRHWHQNDPGSIPNLLFTGAGSPTGMIVYEGNLLPEAFRNQVIHCDAGPNVVRAYPVQNDGAGYKAEIRPLMEGRDQWFRPSDVCVAPDGSLFVSDWYDPGVGGHQMGDLNRGRIYRIASDNSYKIPRFDISTPEAAVETLLSPNVARRYLAWQKLNELGAGAEPALQKVWASDNQRFRARAFWFLSKMPGKGEQYIQQALKDANPDLRIAGIRAAKQISQDVLPYAKLLVKDQSPQVRREIALAIHNNKSPEAASLWTELALQYDGKDRWYLEALGIGADGQWDSFLQAYKTRVGDQLDSKATRDIVWRARSSMALPILANYINNDAVDSAERLRYFRAFDFVEHPSKENVLLGLLDNNGRHKNQIVFTALNHLTPSSIAKSAKAKEALQQSLEIAKGSQEFVDLVGRYNIKSQNEALLQMALAMPDSTLGTEAAGLLLKSGGANLLRNAIADADQQKASAALKVLGRAGTQESMAMMQEVIRNANINMAARKEAVTMLGAGWSESELLLRMVKEGKMPKDLQPTAAVALSGSVRKDIRKEALKYISNTNATGGKPLPSISELIKRNGNIASGKQVFASTCAVCHKVGDEGSQFGPPLTQIGSKLGKDALYTAVLHPDAGISFGYEGYVLKLKDGTEMAGIISSETENDLELSLPGGVKKKYQRSMVASRKEMDNSMMPANLQQAMTEQQLVDLIEYLYSLKGPAKTVASK
jgi:putative membrane-bound dehydrogenase-like protein